MDNNKKGIAPIILMIAIIVGVIVGYVVYIMLNGNGLKIKDSSNNEVNYEETSNPPPADEDVSESEDIDTIEAELDATVTGSPLEEIESLEDDSLEL